MSIFLLFFFQAEDGIRDRTVTGVQTCALPISSAAASTAGPTATRQTAAACRPTASTPLTEACTTRTPPAAATARAWRSEERRVGKECRSQGGGRRWKNMSKSSRDWDTDGVWII